MKYTFEEQMIAACAREIKDGSVVYTGVGLPVKAVLLAMLTHAPNITVLFETGIIRTEPFQLPLGVDSISTQERADMLTSAFYLNTLAERGFVDYAVIGGGQVDRYGNVNSTCIGPYSKPVMRYPGSGGGCDLASLCKKTIVIMKQKRERFPEKVDFITSPGYLDGQPDARVRAGLPENTGPYKVITDMAVYTFVRNELTLESVHTGLGVSKAIVKENLGWEISEMNPVMDTVEPTQEELKIIRALTKQAANAGV